jgi:DnaK suppressor protein
MTLITPVQTSQSASGLDPHLPSIRVELERQRRFRRDQLGNLAAEASKHLAAEEEARREVSRVLRLAAESALVEIEAALQRLDDASYGVCERCEEPIPVERLEVLPMSRLCTPCQYRLESARFRTQRRL